MPSKEEVLKYVISLANQNDHDMIRKSKHVKYSAVYYLIDNDEIVYVGQSIQVFGRLSYHMSSRSKRFNGIVILDVKQGNLNRVEATEIVTHNPKYNQNVCLPVQDKYMTPRQISTKFNADYRRVNKIIKSRKCSPVFQFTNGRKVRYYEVSELMEEGQR